MTLTIVFPTYNPSFRNKVFPNKGAVLGYTWENLIDHSHGAKLADL